MSTPYPHVVAMPAPRSAAEARRLADELNKASAAARTERARKHDHTRAQAAAAATVAARGARAARAALTRDLEPRAIYARRRPASDGMRVTIVIDETPPAPEPGPEPAPGSPDEPAPEPAAPEPAEPVALDVAAVYARRRGVASTTAPSLAQEPALTLAGIADRVYGLHHDPDAALIQTSAWGGAR